MSSSIELGVEPRGFNASRYLFVVIEVHSRCVEVVSRVVECRVLDPRRDGHMVTQLSGIEVSR